MKPTWRDYATILMAFAAVFLCGYGIGHLVGERRVASPPLIPPIPWESRTMTSLRDFLDLRDDQVPAVEQELARTAGQIRTSHQDVLIDYHRHLDELYDRLIALLDEEQASRLRAEKNSLEERIKTLLDGRSSSP